MDRKQFLQSMGFLTVGATFLGSSREAARTRWVTSTTSLSAEVFTPFGGRREKSRLSRKKELL